MKKWSFFSSLIWADAEFQQIRSDHTVTTARPWPRPATLTWFPGPQWAGPPPRPPGRVRAAAAPSPLLEPRCAGGRPLGLLSTHRWAARAPSAGQAIAESPGCPQVSCPVLVHLPSSHPFPPPCSHWVDGPLLLGQTRGCAELWPWPSRGQCPLTEPSSRAGAEDAVCREPLSTARPAGCRWTGGSVCFVLLSPWASVGPRSPMWFASDVAQGCLLGPCCRGSRALSTCVLRAGMNQPAGRGNWFSEEAEPLWLPRWFVAPRARVPWSFCSVECHGARKVPRASCASRVLGRSRHGSSGVAQRAEMAMAGRGAPSCFPTRSWSSRCSRAARSWRIG
ncbi:uncharacterized protein LOC120584686 [Pteropus medius]|uniref:uncharacterized protein LOC120584686 n=1 Tax=Pteropus vampyrus TaxID=132908 RepID=UPI00196A70DA|nr:uncharacterized protein LOC120584686 [Pteropus giganteus]